MRRALDAGPVVNGAPVANGIDTLTTIANYYAYATTLFRRHRITGAFGRRSSHAVPVVPENSIR
jgi:hypothetical protein